MYYNDLSKKANSSELSSYATTASLNNYALKTSLDSYATTTALNSTNTSLGKIKTYVGTDGKLHFTNGAGADTVLNFSSGGVWLGMGLTNSTTLISNFITEKYNSCDVILSTSDGSIKIPSTGRHKMLLTAQWTGADTSNTQMYITINGVTKNVTVITTNASNTFADVFDLNNNDVIKCYARKKGGTSYSRYIVVIVKY